MGSVPEILAPAGDHDSLVAALAAGADAVYLGLDEGLNARARAANFTVDALGSLADRVHRAGARLFLTLNTVVFEDELAVVEGFIRAAAAAGVDGLIVQDPAVALLSRAVAPTMEVHASTQMTISSPEAARFAERLGVVRVVVPRELSVDEIRRFRSETELEIEVFVHGALCMSWSGQCLTSEAWGGRSANRGQCAQSCRLPYELVVDGVRRPLGEVAYLLSPLDLAGVAAVPDLVDAGVHCLKIEGRLKGPAYVTTAVQTYRSWVDACARGEREAHAPRLAEDVTRMAVTYSRGFSPGFFGGSNHQDLVEGRFPKHRGALLGEVAEVQGRSVRVVPARRGSSGGAALAGAAAQGATEPRAYEVPMAPLTPTPGMGVGFDLGRPEEAEPGGPLFSVEASGDGWWLGFGRSGPDISGVRPGHRVWVTRDPRLATEADRAVAAPEPSGRIGASVTLSGAPGAPLRMTWRALGRAGRGATVEVASPLPLAAAAGAGLDAALAHEKLGALGGTPFSLVSVDLAGLAPGCHLPVSALKAARREAAAALTDAVLAAARHRVDPAPARARVVAEAAALRPLRAWLGDDAVEVVPLVRTAEQLEAVLATDAPEVELDWMEMVGLTEAFGRARAAGRRVTVATPRVQKPGEAGIDLRLERLRPDGLLVRHWGGLMHFAGKADAGLRVHGDFALNVTNSVTARHLLALGADTLTAAHDLDEVQLAALLREAPAERITIVGHHHISTFHTEHCVYAHTLSHGRDFRTCGRPCEQHRVALADREGRQHPVVVDVMCRNTVFNAAAQSAAGAVPRLRAAGVRRFRLEFVWERGEQVAEVLQAWRALVAGRASPSEVLAVSSAREQFGVTAGTMRTLHPGVGPKAGGGRAATRGAGALARARDRVE